jgi:maleate cis-trans isomerase
VLPPSSKLRAAAYGVRSTVVENWCPKIVPDGVSVHFAHMLIADRSLPEEIIAMDREDGVGIHQIASCRPHAIAYDWTAWSIVQGYAFDERLRAEIGISPKRR